jgi:hypothetical protein
MDTNNQKVGFICFTVALQPDLALQFFIYGFCAGALPCTAGWPCAAGWPGAGGFAAGVPPRRS